MIVPMAKTYVVVRHEDRQALLAALESLGVLHLVPVRADEHMDEEELVESVTRIKQALHALAVTQAAGVPERGEPAALVKEIIEIREQDEELRTRLAFLEREEQSAARWGRITQAQLASLRECGVDIQLLDVADESMPMLRAALLEVVARHGRGRSLVFAARLDTGTIGGDVHVIPPPPRDLAGVRQEMGRVQSILASNAERLAQLAQCTHDVERELERAEERLSWARARNTGLSADRFFGVQGWLPLTAAESLASDLATSDIVAAVRTRPAHPDERPPTLVYYPRWQRPIRGIFDLLGIQPGYDEVDVSGFFMLAVPLFAGMIIADGGYGLLFLLLPLLWRRRLTAKVGKEKVQLLMLFGAVALIWGAISGVWFGLAPAQLVAAGGSVAAVGNVLDQLQLIRGTEEQARLTLFKICFLLGSIHLVLARVRRMLTLAPDRTALAELGWCGVLAAMLALIWQLFFEHDPLPGLVTRVLLFAGAIGFALVVMFSVASGGPVARIGKGIAGALLPTISTFGDTLSYLRLAAVGLAGYYLAVASNTLAADAAHAGTWAAGLPVLLFGHLLNIGLILIAIFAHGVRLNLLEFSSNAGIQWTGYPFRPFAKRTLKEP